jgi:predicted esterase
MRPRWPLTLIVLVAPAAALAADEAKTGAYHTNFTDRSPQSVIEYQARRFGWNMTQLRASEYEKDYDLSAESFEVNVPDSYKPGDGWGLFVWVSPGGRGNLHEGWRDVLQKHKLVWIGPNKIGNERAIWCRMGLAIDAVHNMKKIYNIDPNRVYIAGASGGGRISSMLGVCYPDVFKGGMYIIGCNYYREMTAPNTGGKVWHRGYAPPPAEILNQAKKNVSHVLLTGETDGNREQTKIYYEQGFKKDGFLHVTYIEVPGMGHQPPNAQWFEKGLLAMENITAQPAAATPATADPAKTTLLQRQKTPATAPSTAKPSPSDEADKLLRNAKVYIDNQLFKQARDRLENILANFPDTPAAKEAKELLRQIRTNE